MGNPMKIRATLQGDVVEVKVLMSHDMESGQRKDAQGEVIPAHFIQTVTVVYQGKTVLAAAWGPAVSKNPFLACKFKGGATGEKVQITWVDNKGDQRTDEATIR
jgi:sulfur-oxidizing protein SoxZ